ncbi:MAG: hypothetical protein AAF921_12400 [Cyanobacteria bacterium P01_D01_bin.44]
MNQRLLIICLIRQVITAAVLLSLSLPATADRRIRGEFEYDLDNRELSEWQIGPAFSLGEDDEIEIEIPIGQDDGTWLIQPEVTYEVEVDDLTLEFSLGVEAPFDPAEPFQPFGSIEGSIDF